MTGEAAFPHVFKMDVWNYRKQLPELDEGFNRAFSENTQRVARELLSAYDFSRFRTIADLGGGYGTLLAVILQGAPHLSGILFDQVHVIDKAASHLQTTGISERLRMVGGDLFVQVPEGADLYLLKSVIHDWNDEQCERILRNCREALNDAGRLLIIERIMPRYAKQHPYQVLLDLRMLAVTGGRERSDSEFRSLLRAADMNVVRMLPLPSGFNIIECMPAKALLP
jgi:trans-aconitate methyltransferase